MMDSPKPILIFIGFMVVVLIANFVVTWIGDKLGRKRVLKSKAKEGGYIYKKVHEGTRGDSQTTIPREGSGQTGKVRIGKDFFEAVSVGKEIKPMKPVEVVSDFERNEILKVKSAL